MMLHLFLFTGCKGMLYGELGKPISLVSLQRAEGQKEYSTENWQSEGSGFVCLDPMGLSDSMFRHFFILLRLYGEEGHMTADVRM